MQRVYIVFVLSELLLLRQCCMAAMAPALTEAATQAKIKLPETSSTNTAASSDTVTRQHVSKVLSGKIGASTNSVQSLGTTVVSRSVLLNGDSQCEDEQSSASLEPQHGQSAAFKSGQDGKDLEADKNNSFQNEFLKTIRHLYVSKFGRTPQIMNQPSTSPDNEEAKFNDQRDKNRSNVQSNEVERSVMGNSKGDFGNAQQPPNSTSVTSGTEKLNTNMCKEQGVGCRVGTPNPKMNKIRSGPSQSQGANDVRKSTPKLVQYCAFLSSSPESMNEVEKVDEELQNVHGEASKKQAQLERRIEFMTRRLRRMQAHQVEQHNRKQLDNYVAHQHRNLQTVTKSLGHSQINESNCDLKKELLSDGVRNLSTAALVTLVQKMQASNSFQQQPPALQQEVTTNILKMSEDIRKDSKETAEKLAMNLRFTQSALDSDATESSSGGESGDDDALEGVQLPVPSTPLIRRAEWKWSLERAKVASRWTWLQAQVSDLEYRIRQQSEVYRQARLSKGAVVLGEPPPPQDLLHASAQPWVVGAGGDTHNRTAGAVIGTGTEVSPLPVSALMSNVDKQASRLTQSLGNCLSPLNTSPASSAASSRPKSAMSSSPPAAPNGLIDSPLSTASVDVEGGSPPSLSLSADSSHLLASEPIDLSPVLDPTCRASRCLPLKHPLRKRKLLRTRGLHLRSAKAARLSSVKCRCHGSVMPCVLCGGRKDIMHTVDAFTMPLQERVALLDHSYHHVLSFHEEVPLSVRFEALLRSGDWQAKAPVQKPRAEPGQRRQKCPANVTDGRKKPFRKNAAAVIIQSAKIRNKYEQKTGRKPGPPRGKRLGKRALNAELKKRKNNSTLGSEVKRRSVKGSLEMQGSSLDTPAASPLSRDALLASGVGAPKEKEVRKRRGESAYDINNIVIPHSMACLSRVEKLEYKEIPIPSWRDLTTDTDEEGRPLPQEGEEEELKLDSHKSNGQLSSQLSSQDLIEDETEEDLSDEAFVLRHQRCEVEERKHFSTFLKLPHSRRNRSSLPFLASSQDLKDSPTVGGGAVGMTSSISASRPVTPSLPVSMGTQASLDSTGELTGGEESLDLSGGYPRWGGSASQPHTPRSSTPVPRFTLFDEDSSSLNISAGGGGVGGSGQPVSRRGSMSSSQRERLNLGSSMEEAEVDRAPVVKPWPLRQFPLSDEEVLQLTAVTCDPAPVPEDSKPQRSLRAVSSMTTLRPQPVDGGSQAGSSLSGSLPASPSPLPSTSSSAAGDVDAADPEWLEDSASKKHGGSKNKAVKR